MKRLIIRSFIITAIPIVILTFLMIGVTDDYSKKSHEINIKLAYERLDSLIDTTKIVIIAGSNGGFGINSQMIVDSLKIPVVNTSTHAGIGVRMQFEMYKDLLRKGDIIIFCPEYYQNNKRLYGESTLYRILSTQMPSAYWKMSLSQWIHTLKYAGIHFQESMKHSKTKAFTGAYSATSVNKYGDITTVP